MAKQETTADIIAEMRGIRVREFQDYADRLEAARKRERGDVAKLREALGKLRAELWNNTVIAGKRKFELYEIADAALAAPPRNCDVMDWRTAWKIWREKFHPETPVGYSAVVKGTEAFMDWFTDSATEKEGGNDGNE